MTGHHQLRAVPARWAKGQRHWNEMEWKTMLKTVNGEAREQDVYTVTFTENVISELDKSYFFVLIGAGT